MNKIIKSLKNPMQDRPTYPAESALGFRFFTNKEYTNGTNKEYTNGTNFFNGSVSILEETGVTNAVMSLGVGVSSISGVTADALSRRTGGSVGGSVGFFGSMIFHMPSMVLPDIRDMVARETFRVRQQLWNELAGVIVRGNPWRL